jgi:undecaprenyl diphosphate synthase
MGKIADRFRKIRAGANPGTENFKFEAVPQHVAIIMDGNGRWAQERGLLRTEGHRAGMERIRDAVTFCLEAGIKYLTLYAFSTENWKRPPEEVGFLMSLFKEGIRNEVNKLHQQNVRVKFLGFRTGLDPALVALMEESEAKTAGNTALTLNFALNYGGRSELLHACKAIARAAVAGEITPKAITETLIGSYLFTAGQPDPDLLIKPGKEFRISNFLIWQMAYTEFYFSELYWPDFNTDAFREAVHFFSRRERRFGGIKKGETTEDV